MTESRPRKRLYTRVHACLCLFCKMALVKTSRFCEGVGVLASPCRQDPADMQPHGCTGRPPKSLENTTFSWDSMTDRQTGRLVPVWQSHRPARARAGQERKIAFSELLHIGPHAQGDGHFSYGFFPYEVSPTRARDGSSRGFANFCAHRTARTREGKGRIPETSMWFCLYRPHARGMVEHRGLPNFGHTL